MGDKLRFTTLFLKCPNIGLVKDVGQVPYHLGKYDDVESTLVSTQLDYEGAFIGEVEGLHLENISLKLKNETVTGIIYLLKHGKEIDWLNLYHSRRNTLILSKIYKWINPNGKVYVKLDAGFLFINDIKNDDKKLKVFRSIIDVADLVSAESSIAVKELMALSRKKIELIPNGTNVYEVNNSIEKENMFLTVGRIGSPEKNCDVLLEAFANIADKCDWNLVLVGEVDNSFRSYIDDFFYRYPQLRDRIAFEGEVTDKHLLFEYYRRAKVFVLPSRFESFGIAIVESMINGCYLVISDQVTPNEDFTKRGAYGLVAKVGEVDDLSKKLLESTEMNIENEAIKMYAYSNYIWDRIVARLHINIVSL